MVIVGGDHPNQRRKNAMTLDALEGRPGWRETLRLPIHVQREKELVAVVWEKV